MGNCPSTYSDPTCVSEDVTLMRTADKCQKMYLQFQCVIHSHDENYVEQQYHGKKIDGFGVYPKYYVWY